MPGIPDWVDDSLPVDDFARETLYRSYDPREDDPSPTCTQCDRPPMDANGGLCAWCTAADAYDAHIMSHGMIYFETDHIGALRRALEAIDLAEFLELAAAVYANVYDVDEESGTARLTSNHDVALYTAITAALEARKDARAAA